MGERKGQNHYYPPDFNYKVHKSLNAYHGTHALRERARKIKQGILIIRFEMPFNVWCEGCKNHVGMGVRYNAEKKKIGMYYTTPLYEFKMKCHLCDNHFIIRTDPKNFDYELVEGLRRQERRFDPAELDNLGAVDRGLTQKLASDAMLKAEHDLNDKVRAQDGDAQTEKLMKIQSRMKYGYELNCDLRRQFRAEKKVLNEERAADEALSKRLSTNIKLAPASIEDTILARRILGLKDEESNFAKRKNKSTSKIPHLKLNTSPKRTSSIDLNNLIVKKSRNDSNEGSTSFAAHTSGLSSLVDYSSD